jgi:tetratricopeptide (TPR) repeat protein
LIGVLTGFLAVGIYIFLPNLDSSEDQFRRATIAERYFKPADRIEAFRNSSQSLQRIDNFEWDIANARANAPDDFPYLEKRDFEESPAAKLSEAINLQKSGDIGKAEKILEEGKSKFPFGRCVFSTNLSVIYYSTNRKQEALTELQNIQGVVGPDSVPDCLRSQFLLGSLYREFGESDKASSAFQDFLKNSEASKDLEIQDFRRQLLAR